MRPLEHAQQHLTVLHVCSWVRQVQVLYRQALLAQLRNPSDTSGRIFVTVFINLLVRLDLALL